MVVSTTETCWWLAMCNKIYFTRVHSLAIYVYTRHVFKVISGLKLPPIGCTVREPKMLTDEHKQKRLAAAHQFLQRHQIEGDQCFDHIVTGDETWISYTNIESKRQSMQWRHSSSPKAKKFKQESSVRKIMATVFWDRMGILLVYFLEPGLTINADAYCETVRKLRRANQQQKTWNAVQWDCAFAWQCATSHRSSNCSTVATISLGSFCPPTLQPRSHTKRLPSVHASKEMVCIPKLWRRR